jgi:hypothetical protein
LPAARLPSPLLPTARLPAPRMPARWLLGSGAGGRHGAGTGEFRRELRCGFLKMLPAHPATMPSGLAAGQPRRKPCGQRPAPGTCGGTVSPPDPHPEAGFPPSTRRRRRPSRSTRQN